MRPAPAQQGALPEPDGAVAAVAVVGKVQQRERAALRQDGVVHGVGLLAQPAQVGGVRRGTAVGEDGGTVRGAGHRG